MGEWDEAKHPRGFGGKFGRGTAGSLRQQIGEVKVKSRRRNGDAVAEKVPVGKNDDDRIVGGHKGITSLNAEKDMRVEHKVHGPGTITDASKRTSGFVKVKNDSDGQERTALVGDLKPHTGPAPKAGDAAYAAGPKAASHDELMSAKKVQLHHWDGKKWTPQGAPESPASGIARARAAVLSKQQVRLSVAEPGGAGGDGKLGAGPAKGTRVVHPRHGPGTLTATTAGGDASVRFDSAVSGHKVVRVGELNIATGKAAQGAGINPEQVNRGDRVTIDGNTHQVVAATPVFPDKTKLYTVNEATGRSHESVHPNGTKLPPAGPKDRDKSERVVSRNGINAAVKDTRKR